MRGDFKKPNLLDPAINVAVCVCYYGTILTSAIKLALLPGINTSPDAEAYRIGTYKKLAAKFLTGPLATLPNDKQLSLVRFAHITANGTTLGSDEFKGNLYLAVDVGSYDSVFNEIRMNQAARLAHVLNDRLLKVLKAFGAVINDADTLHGLRLTFEIPHKNFLHESDSPSYDHVELYAPSSLIKQFDEADITSQKVIDCIVMADGNRVEINLTATTP
jgi:hypothetical protein